MCTVSIIGLTLPAARGRDIPCGFRLVTNRDELRTRPQAMGPRWHDAAMTMVHAGDPEARALFPVDPAGGGTWVGAAPSGLVLCLLNANPTPAPELPRDGSLLSRGMIIPRLLTDRWVNNVDSAFGVLARLELGRFAPFRLVGVEWRPQGMLYIREARWDRTALSQDEEGEGSACFVSSALGDALVKPRLALFDAMVREPFEKPAPAQGVAQDRFHRHVWPERPEISVLMNRSDARTVSITTVEVQRLSYAAAATAVSMRYEAVPETQVVTRPTTPLLGLRRSPD